MNENGFRSMFRAQVTTAEQSPDNIARITFSESYNMAPAENRLAIDIENKLIYVDQSIDKRLDSKTPDGKMKEEDLQIIKDIFVQYDVLNWQPYYGDDVGPNDADGISGWTLQIHFYDDTKKIIVGNLGRDSERYPDGFREFVDKMQTFARSRV